MSDSKLNSPSRLYLQNVTRKGSKNETIVKKKKKSKDTKSKTTGANRIENEFYVPESGSQVVKVRYELERMNK